MHWRLLILLLGWNLDIWRCEAWNEPLGSVFEETVKMRHPTRRGKRVPASSDLLSLDGGADCKADASWETDGTLGPVAKTGSMGSLYDRAHRAQR